MANITLKGVPDDVYNDIRRSAEIHRRSLTQEILFRLERSLAERPIDVRDFLNRADRLRVKAKARRVTGTQLKKAREAGRR